MKNKIQNQMLEEIFEKEKNSKPVVKKEYFLSVSILISSIILAGAWIYTTGLKEINQEKINPAERQKETQVSKLEEKVLPAQGIILPVTWGSLGIKLVDTGIIDINKLKVVYNQRGSFTKEYENLLLEKNDDKLKITNENAGYLLNLFWALGLASKNEILESGEMTNLAYGGAGNFASTGGWTIAKGNAMDHYSKHKFFNLTSEQQTLVDKISRGIYRPCCGNSTHFPDCNHGMAMLGLLELMASQGVSEQNMWKTALAVNSYWFPDTYLTIASYMKSRGVEWKDVNPQEMLSADYSSAQGYARINAKVIKPEQQKSGSGCNV